MTTDQLMYLIPIMGVIGLVVMIAKAVWVNKQDAGEANMKELAGYIADGALAFLKAEWRVLGVFAVIAGALLAWSGTLVEHSDWVIAVAFLIGAFFSAFAGWIGMNIATKANVRTTQAARTSLSKALAVSFNGGTVMGLGVAGLAVLGLSVLFIVFYNMYAGGGDGTGSMETALEVLAGFSLGAESIALFARVGGGIYTKAADVGADLVGKVEQDIPEDDPRNPATVADNVGDNVGDVAGMGADLFGSYVATMLATMVLGREVVSADNFNGLAPILLPMVIAGLGLLFSIVGTFFVRISGEDSSVMAALNKGNWGSIILTAIASYFVIDWMLPDTMQFVRGGVATELTAMNVFYAVILGLVVGALMSIVTEYYTSMGRRPVDSIVQQSGTGHATNVIGGLAMGMESTVIPIIILASGIYGAFALAGIYGVAIAAAGMMATTAMQLAIDAFGPIADNAGGIAEMSGLPEEVRGRTDNLDAVGNTTAATGKGFAIASAALTALALFAAYVGLSGIDGIDIYKADVLAMLFVGGMIPFWFSSLAISAVGKAAMDMVKEVRRQFREIPGIMEGTAKPEYEKCVDISTKASIRQMILPGALALVTPAVVGFAFGPEALGGLLAGITVSGVLMGMFQNNAGGAWDNAKKSFEKAVVIDGQEFKKGSEPHKAAVTGDTVGDPFKDTSGPSMNILIKLTSIVALIIAPHISEGGAAHGDVDGHAQVFHVDDHAGHDHDDHDHASHDHAKASSTTHDHADHDHAEHASANASSSGTYARRLNSGYEVNGYSGGVEDKLIAFIESAQPIDKTTWFNFDRVNFASGSADLDLRNSKEQLYNIANIMKAFPAVKLKVGGYTDDTGKEAENMKLSQKRADNVKKALENMGVAGDRLDAEGYGSKHPLASNESEGSRAKNRRMAVRVTDK